MEILADRIREYEGRVHPWPDTSTPASVLASLMDEHGLRQSDLPEIGSQGVVSEVLAGKRQLNLHGRCGRWRRGSRCRWRCWPVDSSLPVPWCWQIMVTRCHAFESRGLRSVRGDILFGE